MNVPDVLRQTLADYARLHKGQPGDTMGPVADALMWPDLVLVGVKKTDIVKAGLEPASVVVPNGAEGWVRCRSAVGVIGAVRIGDEDIGPVIAAEWVTDTGAIHLRPDPEMPGRLCQFTYTVRELGDQGQTADEIACLRQEIRVMAPPLPQKDKKKDEEKDFPVLLYHVFWGAEESNPYALSRLFTTFAGFGNRDMVIPADQGHDPDRSAPSKQAKR